MGPFRKGKKAWRANKQNKAALRYLLFITKRIESKKQAIKIVKAAVVAAMGVADISRIRACAFVQQETKALLIAKSIIDTASQLNIYMA